MHGVDPGDQSHDIARAWLHDRYVAKVNAALQNGSADVESLLEDFAADDPDALFTDWVNESVERLVSKLDG